MVSPYQSVYDHAVFIGVTRKEMFRLGEQERREFDLSGTSSVKGAALFQYLILHDVQ